MSARSATFFVGLRRRPAPAAWPDPRPATSSIVAARLTSSRRAHSSSMSRRRCSAVSSICSAWLRLCAQRAARAPPSRCRRSPRLAARFFSASQRAPRPPTAAAPSPHAHRPAAGTAPGCPCRHRARCSVRPNRRCRSAWRSATCPASRSIDSSSRRRAASVALARSSTSTFSCRTGHDGTGSGPRHDARSPSAPPRARRSRSVGPPQSAPRCPTSCARLRPCAWHRSAIRCWRLVSRCCKRGNSWASRRAAASCFTFARLASSASVRRRSLSLGGASVLGRDRGQLLPRRVQPRGREVRWAVAACTACDAPSSSARLRFACPPRPPGPAPSLPHHSQARLELLDHVRRERPLLRTCSSPSRSASSVLISAFLKADSGRLPWAEKTDVKKVSGRAQDLGDGLLVGLDLAVGHGAVAAAPPAPSRVRRSRTGRPRSSSCR
jgi:hypothetical protein